MRPVKMIALVLFATLFVLLAAVCGGGDGDGNGDGDGGRVEFDNEQILNVQGFLEIALLEEFVSASPVLQTTTGFSGEGTGTARLGFAESGTIQFGDLQIDFKASSEDGETIQISARADPDQSTGMVDQGDGGSGAQGWSLSLAMDFGVDEGRPPLTSNGPVQLNGFASLDSKGNVAGATVSTEDGLSVDLIDEDGQMQGDVSAVVLAFVSPTVLP